MADFSSQLFGRIFDAKKDPKNMGPRERLQILLDMQFQQEPVQVVITTK